MIQDTIAAISTPLGEGGIGIIRVSGNQATEILEQCFKSNKIKDFADIPTHTIHYGYIVDKASEEKIDEVLVTFMKAPRTFTGEDIVEVNCHGGIIPLQKVLRLILNKGARLAEPGEFSKRAFLNGKIDLAQAESIIDLIRAKTDLSLKVAVSQLEGSLSNKIKALRHRLLEVIAFIEAGIDFPEEDIEELTESEIEEKTKGILEDIIKLISSAETGKIIREGLKTVIVGKPNVGKSSLLNALLKEKRAIVTDIPGTTRDVIEEMLSLGGIPLKIVDTAGIRETEDLVEKIGVEKSKEIFNQADLVLFVLDAAQGFTESDLEIAEMIKDKEVITIINKMDLIKDDITLNLPDFIKAKTIVKVSVLEEAGLDLLEESIKEKVLKGEVAGNDSSLVTNIRHKNSLEKARKHMEGVLASLSMGMPTDCMAIDLKDAWDLLGEITGETVGEDILDQIFSQFCIGK